MISEEVVRFLAMEKFQDEGCSTPDEQLFALLVAVGQAYLHELESLASNHPAPYFNQSTPLEALLQGLKENLDTEGQ